MPTSAFTLPPLRLVTTATLLSCAIPCCYDDDPRPPDVYVDPDRFARRPDTGTHDTNTDTLSSMDSPFHTTDTGPDTPNDVITDTIPPDATTTPDASNDVITDTTSTDGEPIDATD